MNKTKSILFIFFIAILPSVFCNPAFTYAEDAALNRPWDHSAWQNFLDRFVNSEGDVDYQGVQENPKLLEEYLGQIAELKWGTVVGNWPREEKMALLINAYHAGLVDAVRKHYPIKEVGNITGVWDQQLIHFKKKSVSLNSIRKDELITVFRDPKIHFVLSNGAKGGPRLSPRAFTGPTLESQIFKATRDFMTDPSKVKIIPGKKKIQIAKLFKWYAKDFKIEFSFFENERGFTDDEFSVVSFLANYVEDADQVRFLEEETFKIKYLPYDWSLNEWKRGH